MGAALYIVLEKSIPDFDPFVNGKALSADEKRLDRLARELGVTPLMDFFGMNPEDVADFLEAEAEASGQPAGDLPHMEGEKWFAAGDGLATVRALRQRLREEPKAVRDPKAIISDLDEFETVLERARSADVRWHVAVDF